MKKIKLSGIDEEIIYEKLPNGLDVYLYNKEGITNNYVTFTTKFGSIYNEFIPINEKKTYKIPNGVAHFLEHKVFVQENDPQPTEFFSEYILILRTQQLKRKHLISFRLCPITIFY